MNADLVNKALVKVINPNVLVNLVSRRVRQLTSGNGGLSRPLIANADNMSAADIALTEIIEEKIGFDLPQTEALTRPAAKNHNRPAGWVKYQAGTN
jgi:DNA-directed RNA polymerase subunit omega